MARKTVSIGDPVEAAHHNQITQFGDADHDWDTSTGTGYHRASYDGGLHLVDETNNNAALVFFDSDGRLKIKVATGTTTPPTVADPDTEGKEILLADDTTDTSPI